MIRLSAILILIMLVSSSGAQAGFFDASPVQGQTQNQESQWNWQKIKDKVVAKFSSLMSRWRGEDANVPVVNPVATQTPTAPQGPATPTELALASVLGSPAPAGHKARAERKIMTEAKTSENGEAPSSPEVVIAKPVVAQPVVTKPAAKVTWLSYLLDRIRGTEPQPEPTIQKSTDVSGQGLTTGVAVPVPQSAEVVSTQVVPAGQPKAPSVFDRFRAWVVSFSSPAAEREPASVEYTKIQDAAPQVNSINASRIATPAIPFKDENLILGHNNIPVFRFKRLESKLLKEQIRQIPLLNLGQEAILDSNTFKIVPIKPYPRLENSTPKSLETPEEASNSTFRKMLGDEVELAKAPEKIEIPILEAAKKVTGEKIAKLVYTLLPDSPYVALTVVKFTEEDLKLLRGLILFEKKDQCHVASGIFADLVDSKVAEVSESSQFHLGSCLHEMNLPTEAVHHLTKTIKSKNPQFSHDSIKAAVEDVQLQYEATVVEALLQADEKNYPKESLAQINYLKAKYFFKKNQNAKAVETAQLVPPSAPAYYKAQYVAAIAEYVMGKPELSLNRQKAMAAELTKNGKDKNTLALFEMNIGRSAFQVAKYKDSLEAFQKVPKENSLWIQSLMEEAWVQLQSKDMAGAIGNMHSIQSPYFNGVYKPESYVLRSIAYLSICQYADAFKSIAYLEHTYQPWLEKLNTFNSTHNSSQSYDTVIRHLQAKTNPDTDGLPFQAIREAARQRDFLNAQESVNQLIDENSGYPFIRSLIEKDRKSLVSRRNAAILKVAQLREKVKKAALVPDGMKNLNAWRFEMANAEDFLSVYDFKVQTLHEGLDGLNRLIPKAQSRIAENKEKVKLQAGKIIKEHFVKLAKELRQSLDNDELLKYEVYAGSGENLRYKIAGGKTGGSSNMSDRKPAGQHWDFDGEFWEDEIGNYRSSLKNNCQNVTAGQSAKVK